MIIYYKQRALVSIAGRGITTTEIGFNEDSDAALPAGLTECADIMKFIREYFCQDLTGAYVRVNFQEIILATTLIAPFIDRLTEERDLHRFESMALALVKLMRLAIDQVVTAKEHEHAQAEGVH